MTFLFHYVLPYFVHIFRPWGHFWHLVACENSVSIRLSSDQWGTDEFESKVCELFGSSARVSKGDWIFFDDFLWEEKGTGSGS